ncbi:MAG: magnesium transporter [Alphaproteobacteria bacterium]
MQEQLPDDTEVQPGLSADGSPEGLYGLTDEAVDAIREALAAADAARVLGLVRPLHESELADLIDRLGVDERRALIATAGSLVGGEVLAYLDENVREAVMRDLEPREIAAAISDLDTDDAVSVLEDLDASELQEVLEALPSEDRAEIEDSLAYPESSAGRLMQREVVGLPADWSVGQVIDHMRETDELPDDFYEIYVVDAQGSPVGTVPLSRLMRSQRAVVLRDIMDAEVKSIPATTDQEEVARVFQQYNLVSAPVVAPSGRLIGAVTADDVVGVSGAEAEEDVLLMSGVSSPDIYRDVLRTAKGRFTWLFVNLFTAMLVSSVIYQFDGTIEQMVGLAVLMPIVASMGGNAGTQTMAVVVRAIATRDLSPANVMRVLLKEGVVGGMNGVLFASLVGTIAGLWYRDLWLGVVIGAALIINLVVAGLFGLVIPYALWRLRIDPATAAGVFLTTMTDVIGFVSFLGLATIFLL